MHSSRKVIGHITSRYDKLIEGWGSAQTRITMEMLVYKWLLLVVGEIINRNNIYLLLVAIG